MSTDEIDSMLRAVAAAPAVRPPPRIGDRLDDRYVIEAFLGEGGMGMVFRARDEKLGDTVALKLVRAADDQLRDEVRLAQKVTHPNVCRTFDLEDIGGRQLIKMEFVPGETLATRLRGDRLPIAEVVRIARAIADGLAASHKQQIVHGDLKPGNVMLDGDRVVLMDFGIARHMAAPVDGVRGTIGYIAPEVVRDQAADARADYYALGCVLYEMLTGEHVFGTGPTIAIAARHVSDPVPDVRRLRRDTPRWLARACQDLLAKRPADRAAGIARLNAGPRSPARVIGAIALAVIAVAAFATWRLTRTQPAWIPAVQDYPVFRENMDFMQFSPDGHWLVFAGDRDGPTWHGYLMSRETGEATQIMSSTRGDIFGPTFTRDGTALLYTINDGGTGRIMRQPITGSPPRPSGPPQDLFAGWYPADCGDALAYSVRSLSGARLMLRVAGGEERQLYAGGEIGFISCDPAGQHIAFVENPLSGGDVIVVDRTGNVRHVTADRSAFAASFASDGHSLIVSKVVGGKKQLFEVPVAGGTPRRLVTDDGPDVVNAVSRDGHFLAFTRDTTSHTPVLLTARAKRPLTRLVGDYDFPQFASTDQLVVQVADSSGYRVARLAAGDGTITPLASGRCPFPSPDERAVYFESERGVLSVVGLDGGPPRRLATLPGALVIPGNAGPDGVHVLVNVNERLAGYHVTPEGAVTSDDVRGLIAVAPTTGWRAVTLFSDAIDSPVELALVEPGQSLAESTRRFTVTSWFNRWLDSHRVAYCVADHCETLDVTTGAVARLDVEPAVNAVLSPDGTSVATIEMAGTVTRHLITNFDQR